MARHRRSSRSHRMHGFGVLGSEPMSWGSLAVGAVVGYGLAMLVSRASQSSGTAIQGLGAKKKGPSAYCLKYPNASWCASMYGK